MLPALQSYWKTESKCSHFLSVSRFYLQFHLQKASCKAISLTRARPYHFNIQIYWKCYHLFWCTDCVIMPEDMLIFSAFQVCELDIIFNFEKAYFILDEFLLGGEVQETSKKNVLKAIEQADLLQEVRRMTLPTACLCCHHIFASCY